jgi:hypothetical protein
MVRLRALLLPEVKGSKREQGRKVSQQWGVNPPQRRDGTDTGSRIGRVIESRPPIYEGTGFSDLSSFNRQFRRIAGKTLSAYRR